MSEPDGFRDYVATRSPALLRFAWVLTGDWHAAEDLVQTALANTWPRWQRIRRSDDPDVYVRRAIVNANTSWHRRRMSGEMPTQVAADSPVPDDPFAAADAREVLRQALSGLPARQRAVVALRFLDDLPEKTVADILGCAVGTVKSQVSKALAKLREEPMLRGLLDGDAEARR